MAEEQDNITPEEKLLNVIQSDGEPEATAKEKPVEAVEAAPAAAPAPAEEAAPAEEKPALKLAPQPEGEAAVAATEAEPGATEEADAVAEAASADAAPAAAPAPASAPTMSFAKKKAGGGSGVKFLNRMLAAGVLILLSLSGYESFMVMRARGAPSTAGVVTLPAPKELILSLLEVQEGWAIDPFHRPKVGGDGPVGPTKRIVEVDVIPWATEMKHFKLMGVSIRVPKSDSEAILLDNRTQEMYFIKLGKTINIQGTEVRLDDLEAERVRFTDGSSSFELK
jgi:hypothetical protein